MPALSIEPLSREAFRPFGEVIDTQDRDSFLINGDSTRRYHALARVELARPDDTAIISIFRAQARTLPLHIDMLERHPLGSQAFIPLHGQSYLVVVAPPAGQPQPGCVRAFLARAGQGVNYACGVWHYPLIALSNGDFLVVDRSGTGNNCDEYYFPDFEPPTVPIGGQDY